MSDKTIPKDPTRGGPYITIHHIFATTMVNQCQDSWEGWEQAGEEIGDFFQETRQELSDFYQQSGEAIGEYYRNLGEGIGEYYQQREETIKNIVDESKQELATMLADNNVDQSVIDKASAIMTDLAEDLVVLVGEDIYFREDVVSKLLQADEFSHFLAYLNQTTLLEELDFAGTKHTIFVPSLDAMLKATEGENPTPERLTAILRYHIIPNEELDDKDDFEDGQALTTAYNNEQLVVKKTEIDNDNDDDDDIDFDLFDEVEIVLVGATNEAKLYDESEEYDMGVLHLIDTLLLPP